MAKATLTPEERAAKREYHKQWRAKNIDKVRAQAREHAALRKDEINAQRRAQYAAKPRALRGYDKKYADNNAERKKESQRKWRLKNRPKMNEMQKVRQRRVAAAGPKPSKEDIHFLYEAQKGLCNYCGIHMWLRYHRDHIMPLILGGSNERSNLQLLCAPCNRKKGSKHPDIFAAEMAAALAKAA